MPVMPTRSCFFEPWRQYPISINAAGMAAGSDDEADASSISTDTKLVSFSAEFVTARREPSAGISCEEEAPLLMAGKVSVTRSSSPR